MGNSHRYTQAFTLDIPEGGAFPGEFTLLVDARTDPVVYRRSGVLGTTAFGQTYGTPQALGRAIQEELAAFATFTRLLSQVSRVADVETVTAVTDLSFADEAGPAKTGFFRLSIDRTVSPVVHTVEAEFEGQGFTKSLDTIQPFITMLAPLQKTAEQLVQALKLVVDVENLR